MKNYLLLTLLSLTACAGMRTPGTSGNPSKMSADTLCYRATYAKSGQALQDEVRARNLDCRAILESQTPVGESRY